ncbi:MAG: Rrf2 family transcriptional regulator [Clostridia bacterium]
MKLSTRGKYGLYAMYYLASHQGEGPQTLQSISTIGVPKQYLEQLLGSLRRAGLVSTVRGAQGGYQMSRPAAEVSLLQIIDAVEGPIELSECTSDEHSCDRACSCPVRWVWQQVSERINAELDGIKLSDMLTQQRQDGNSEQCPNPS